MDTLAVCQCLQAIVCRQGCASLPADLERVAAGRASTIIWMVPPDEGEGEEGEGGGAAEGGEGGAGIAEKATKVRRWGSSGWVGGVGVRGCEGRGGPAGWLGSVCHLLLLCFIMGPLLLLLITYE